MTEQLNTVALIIGWVVMALFATWVLAALAWLPIRPFYDAWEARQIERDERVAESLRLATRDHGDWLGNNWERDS